MPNITGADPAKPARKVSLWVKGAAYLLLWPLSTPLVDPTWPTPCGGDAAPHTRRISRASFFPLDIAAAGDSIACSDQPDAAEALIRRTPICIVSTKAWAGDLGKSLLYQTRKMASDRIVVGYFAYWTTERAWGDNDLTRWVLPAVAIDALYSHLFFVFPGVQRFLYGPGDVEGLRVTFKLGQGGRLITPVADRG